MKTREEIEAELRATCPSSTLPDGTTISSGSDEYESLLQKWIDKEEAKQQQRLIGDLPFRLLAEFEKLSDEAKTKWYANGVKSGARDALKDGKPSVARAIIAAQVADDETEATTKANLLAILDRVLE